MAARRPPPRAAASAVLGAGLSVASALGVPAMHPAAHERRVPVRIVVSTRSGPAVSKDAFGANLLWSYGAAGAFDAATRRFYPGFVAMVRRMGITAIRYPGGETADSFQWERAIGPIAKRLANEPYGVQGARLARLVVDGPVASLVGPDEFGALLSATHAVGNVVVNFATGTVRQAADLVAYMTAPLSPGADTKPSQPGYWAALRAANGHPAPYDVPYWEVGNEQLVPAEFGWRSGSLVALGPHGAGCPASEVKVCLYAFGGTTRFSHQPVGTLADELPAASYSDGRSNQRFFVYYPPVVRRSEVVMVDGVPWHQVASFARAGRDSTVFTFNAASGAITFGNGDHGAIPPAGAQITTSYESGPHGGFVEFYRAMKRMNPQIQVCQAEQPSIAFLKLMGRRFPYDCVEDHPYAAPRNSNAPLRTYEQRLMTYPQREGAFLGRLQRLIRHYAGRNVPVVVTEYGQLVKPMPQADPHFILSLDEALLVAAQLRQWIEHGVPLAEKYLLTASPFPALPPVGRGDTIDPRLPAPYWEPGLRIGSAMIAGPGPHFVAEPSGEALSMMSKLAGMTLLRTSVRNVVPLPLARSVPSLLVTAASGTSRRDLLVINDSPSASYTAAITMPGTFAGQIVRSETLNGTSASAYNTTFQPTAVSIRSRRLRLRSGNLSWHFPAHSVTLLEFDGTGPAPTRAISAVNPG